MLGGLGLASIGVGAGMNYLQGDPAKGFNRDLASYQRQIQGDPGSAGLSAGWGKFGLAGFGARPATPGRGAPQAGAAAQGQTSDFRGNQADLISRLEAMSKGQGPSLAAEQLRQATDRNMGQQASIAQSGRGNAALAGLTAANQGAQLGQQAASDSAVARIAEQQMALQQLGGAINQGRTSDQDLSQFNALQTNYRDQFNIEAQLRARGMDDQAIQAILAMKQTQANKPTMGDQLMAGGAGMLSQWATNQKGGGGGGGAGAGMMTSYGSPGTTSIPGGWYNIRGAGA